MGYALAMADLGRYHKAAWAMRRAVRIDRSGVRYLDAPKGIHARLDELAKTYRHRGARHGRADDWFMAAALYYLADEHEHAREALEHVGHEHARESTSNLDELIAEHHS